MSRGAAFHPGRRTDYPGSMDSTLRIRTILTFWLPLAAAWLMMGAEGPYLSAIVARMDRPVENLAAFGLSFTLAWLVESPIIMLLSASTALCRDRASFLALRRFAYLLNGTLTAILVVVALPPVFRLLAQGVLGLPADVVHLANLATAMLAPWPAAIGYRRFHQGLLVRTGQTRRVAYGTVLRLVTMSLAAAGLALGTRLPGACIGALALSSGVVAEAAASRWMAHRVVRDLLDPGPPSGPAPTFRELARYYYPLALTSIIAMATAPLLTFFMGRGRDPLQCLAAWPVVHAFVFFFRSGGSAFQEVGVALTGADGRHAAQVRRAATLLAAGSTALMAVAVFTPLGALWFRRVVGLGAELLPFALLPAQVLLLLPAMEYLLSFQRSRWILAGRTSLVSTATALETVGLTLSMALFALVLDWRGTLAAALALTLGRSAACGYLLRKAADEPFTGSGTPSGRTAAEASGPPPPAPPACGPRGRANAGHPGEVAPG